MSNFDDIFDTQSARKNLNDQPFDKDAWAEKKQAERKAVYDLADTTAEAVSMDGGKYRDYLDVQARFDRYSATNIFFSTILHAVFVDVFHDVVKFVVHFFSTP